MSVKLRRRPHGSAPAPAPKVPTQEELRQARRSGSLYTPSGLPFDHAGTRWSVVAEVEAITEPLAERIADESEPSGYLGLAVADLVTAAHSLASFVVGAVVEADAYRRTEQVPRDQRGRSIRLLVDMAPRPELPTVTAEHLADGTWPDLLIGMAQPYDAGFAELMARTHPTGAFLTSGRFSLSERLRRELCEVDRAARAAHHKLDVMARHRQKHPDVSPAATAESQRQAVRAELAALGVELPDQSDLI